ncbi:MAG TPA: SCO family protein [Terriglobia bacterium]|nr:SCO family protein [Terriglobia bacterium]
MQVIKKRDRERVKSPNGRRDIVRRVGTAAQLSLLVFSLAMAAAGQDNASITPAQLRGVGIDQRLNNQVPLDLKFREETGQTVTLGSYFGKKPVILSLVYYACPMLCTMAENGLLNALRDVKFNIGEQYEVVTVSIDPSEKPEMAMGKKAVYVGLYGRPAAKQGWHFLVGAEPSIRALAQAVGFHYNYLPETRQFAHATGIIVLTPQGKVSRYFYGILYPARDIRLALVEASNEKIGNPVDAVLLYCCEYNPATGKYGMVVSHVLKIAGVITLLCMGTLIFALSRGGGQNSIQDSKF